MHFRVNHFTAVDKNKIERCTLGEFLSVQGYGQHITFKEWFRKTR